MTDLQQRIEDMLFDGLNEVEIAAVLNLSVEEVEAQIALIEEAEYDAYEPDCDDSDDGYALASAGLGMDEDYGFAGEDY